MVQVQLRYGPRYEGTGSTKVPTPVRWYMCNYGIDPGTMVQMQLRYRSRYQGIDETTVPTQIPRYRFDYGTDPGTTVEMRLLCIMSALGFVTSTNESFAYISANQESAIRHSSANQRRATPKMIHDPYDGQTFLK